MADGQAAARWCKECGKPVELIGKETAEDEFRRPVHTATGQERGAHGHRATPVDHEPPHWKSARILAAEFKGIFAVEAWFGFLRADWTNIPIGMVAGHFEADDEETMRLKLKAAVAGLQRAQADGPLPADGTGPDR